ncbi:hypothetical protein GCM10011587_07630 [Pyruvatibacter mobilis]|nr:hypothetical protein GCM10011587_07630 [Pyruvatibacter mobilis]
MVIYYCPRMPLGPGQEPPAPHIPAGVTSNQFDAQPIIFTPQDKVPAGRSR